MKTIFLTLWKPPCRRVIGVCFFLCASILLIPPLRQTIFGPKIDGIPVCIWEHQIRNNIMRSQARPWYYTALEKAGVIDSRRGWISYSPDLLPVMVTLAEDGDVEIRREILWRMNRWDPTAKT